MRLAIGHLLAAGGSDSLLPWANGKLNEIWATLGLGYKVGTAGFLLGVLVFRRTLGKFLIALALAGIGWWAVLAGGVATVANMFGGETPHPAIVQQVTTPPTPAPPATP